MKQILSDFIRVINESSPNKDTMVYSLVLDVYKRQGYDRC